MKKAASSEESDQLVVKHFEVVYKHLKGRVIEDTVTDGVSPSPMVIIGNYENGLIRSEVFAYEGHDTMEKLAKLYSKKLLNNVYPVFLIQVSEVWLKKVAKEEADQPYEPLADENGNPKANVEEALIIAGTTFDKSKMHFDLYSIIRNEKDSTIQDLVESPVSSETTAVEANVFNEFFGNLVKFGGDKLRYKLLNDIVQ